MKIPPICTRGMVDEALHGDSVLRDFTDVASAQAVLAGIARHTKPCDVLRQIATSEVMEDLIKHLPTVYGRTRQELEPLLECVLADINSWDELCLDGDYSFLETFANTFWCTTVCERLKRGGDERRAWEDIKRAYRGLVPKESELKPNKEDIFGMAHGSPEQITASPKAVAELVGTLYEWLAQRKLVPISLGTVSLENLRREESWQQRNLKGIPGTVFAREMLNHGEEAAASQVLEIAEYFAEQRKVRARKRAQG